MPTSDFRQVRLARRLARVQNQRANRAVRRSSWHSIGFDQVSAITQPPRSARIASIPRRTLRESSVDG